LLHCKTTVNKLSNPTNSFIFINTDPVPIEVVASVGSVAEEAVYVPSQELSRDTESCLNNATF